MSQNSKILQELRRRKGGLASTVNLAKISGSYAVHSRINDLRQMGHEIHCFYPARSSKKAWYKLVE